MPYVVCWTCQAVRQTGAPCEPCSTARTIKRQAQRASRQDRGYNGEYNRNRRAVLADQPKCAICRRQPATTADHIIALSRGGTNDINNLRPACSPCNTARGDGTRETRR